MLWLRRHRTNISCLPKTQGSEDHGTRANIVTATTTSIDVHGPSDGANMDTDPGPQAVEEMRSSATSNGQSKVAHTPLKGRQITCDMLPSHTTATSIQIHDTPNPLKCADQEPEFDQTPSIWARTAEDVPAVTNEWSPFPTRRRPYKLP